LVVKKRAAEAKVETFSCHDLRRTFITNLLDSGCDLSTVQKLAGHKNISTTIIYDRRGESAKLAGAMLLPNMNF
jgi:site-specific recombinase XerD